MSSTNDKTTLDACVSYFNKITQYDIPIRQINKYTYVPNPVDSNGNPVYTAGSNGEKVQVVNPCNTWICDNFVTEYDCMGLTYTPNVDNNGIINQYTLSYKTLKEWATVWSSGYCTNLFSNIVKGYGTSQSATAFNLSNFQIVQDDFSYMFSRFFNQDPSTAYTGTDTCKDPKSYTNSISSNQTGGKFSNADNDCNVWINGTYSMVPPGQVGYNNFLDVLFSACQAIPGACSKMQNYMCQNCSREQIYANPYLTNFCGCVPYIDTGTAFYNSAMSNFSQACDPLCNKADTIKYVNESNGQTEACNANVCVMDAIQINSLSSAGIVPTFNQVCPACADGQGNCICIVDATFDSTIPSVKGNDGQSLDSVAKFTQYCPNSQCYIANPDTGQFESVACGDTLPKGNGNPPVKVPWWVFLVALIIIVIAILAIFAYKYSTSNVPIYLVSSKYEPY